MGPVIDELIELYRNFGSAYWAEHGDAASAPAFSSDPSAVYNEMIGFIYDHADEFRLAVKSRMERDTPA